MLFGQNSVRLKAATGGAEDLPADRMGGGEMAPEKGPGFRWRYAPGQARVEDDGIAVWHDDMKSLAKERLEAVVEGGAQDEGGEDGVVAANEDAVDDPSVAPAYVDFGGVKPCFTLLRGPLSGPAHGSAGGRIFQEAQFSRTGHGKDGGVGPGDAFVKRGAFKGRHENHAPAGVGGVVSEGRGGGKEEGEKSALAAAAWSGSGHG